MTCIIGQFWSFVPCANQHVCVFVRAYVYELFNLAQIITDITIWISLVVKKFPEGSSIKDVHKDGKGMWTNVG